MKYKVKKHTKKFLAAAAIGVLVVSGLAINAAALDDHNNQNCPADRVIKEIKNNPMDFFKTTKISVPDEYDYIQQMNIEFVNTNNNDNMSYMPGDSLKESIKESKDVKEEDNIN